MTDFPTGRRSVLKATTGLLVLTGLSNSAAANGPQDESYGNGNGIGAFLNEEAEWKDHPIWTGEMADMRGEQVVDVDVGAMTPVNIPDPEAPPNAPFAFAPQAIKVSPGATVRWTWVSNPFGFPIPHDVRSLVDDEGDPVLEEDGDPSFHSPLRGYKNRGAEEPDEKDLPTFEHTFTERGNHLYFCTPHGAPFEHHGHYNLVGMRGAVQVSGKPL